MFESTVKKIVDTQIENGTLSEGDRNIYLYGYQMLIEFSVNIITSLITAVVFQAYGIVIVFTVAYLLLRGYVGGYHAKTSLGCFCISACMLLAAVFFVQYVAALEIINWLFLLENIMLPCVICRTPIPVTSKPITNNEKYHFKRKVKLIYPIELLAEILLLFLEKDTWALSILAVHIVLFIMVIVDLLKKHPVLQE